MGPINPETWAIFFEQSADFLNGRVGTPETVRFKGELPKLSFPVYYEKKVYVFGDNTGASFGGSLLFFNGDVQVEFTENPRPFMLPEGVFRRSFELSSQVEPAVREMINQKYLFSGNFLSFVSSGIGVRENVITTGLVLPDIEGSSFNLAAAMFLLLQPIKDKIDKRIALTGEILCEGESEKKSYMVKGVKGIFEKLSAVLCYPIEKFYVPKDNENDIEEIIRPLNEKKILRRPHDNSVIILLPERNLEIILVSKLEDVIKDLFGNDWQKLSWVMQKYSLGHRYKREILKSGLPKIRNILGKELSKEEAEMEDYYVKLRIVEKKDVRKKLNGQKKEQSEGTAEQKYLEMRIKRELPPIFPVEILKNFDRTGHQSVVIFGEAGSGKSTILRNILYQLCLCEKEIPEVKDLLPVYMPLGALGRKNGDFASTIINNLDVWTGIPSLDQVYKKYLKVLHADEKILFLLDALDEATGMEGNIHKDIESLGKVIVTSRYATMAFEGKTELYEVMPFGMDEIKNFAEKYLMAVEERQNFLKYIDSQAGSAMIHQYSNPLLLSLALAAMRGGTASLNLSFMSSTRLVNRGVNLLINKRLTDKRKELIGYVTDYELQPLEATSLFLCKVAFQNFDKYEIERWELKKLLMNVFPREEFPGMGVDVIDDVIDAFTSGTGILEFYREEDIGGHEKKTYYRFFHRVFYEYFVARYVVDVVSNNETTFKQWINEHKFDIRYRNVLRVVAGLLDIQVEEQGDKQRER